jgi:CRISPR/Cas system CSM-associated protein Csm3 (group 7 of RAMP superfamily)
MRDLDAYSKEGRNNPHDPDQMREHPYDFVSLPDAPKKVTAPGHDTYPQHLYSGTLVLVYRTETPLHVGSGAFESSVECGLSGPDQPVRGIVRREGRPVFPGSSWKGAVRARYEAVTRSRLALAKDFYRFRKDKTPQALKNKDDYPEYEVRIRDPRLERLRAVMVKKPEHLKTLSPAESLFGAMGYRGRVHPADGIITGTPAGEPLQVAPMESPAPHRLAQAGEALNRGRIIEIRAVEGRKFYYDGDLVRGRAPRDNPQGTPIHEFIDSVPRESKIRLEVHLEAVSLAELGVLLICSGQGGEAGIVRFGGFKSVGLGKVELVSAEARLHQGASTRSWKRSIPHPLELSEAVHAAHQSLIDAVALAELKAVTTLKRP